MKAWIGRNWLAFGVIAAAAVIIAITIIRPAWERNIGDDRPDTTVGYGQSVTIGGVRWHLSTIKPPSEAELRKYHSFTGKDDDLFPPNSQLVTYVLHREKDGKPAAVPAEYSGCVTSVVDGERRWTQSGLTPMPIMMWADDQGLKVVCQDDGPLLVAIFVPADAHITAVDVLFNPKGDPDDKSLSTSHSRTIFRFDAA